MQRTENFLNKEPQKFWDFVRKNQSNFCIPKFIKLNGISCNDEQDTANMFSSYFNSIYFIQKAINTDLSNLDILSYNLPNSSSFSVDVVFISLSKLNGVTSIGPDGISGLYLYNLRYTLAFPLWLLFRRSLLDGIFPDLWKISYITPVLKLGDASLVENYRSISILSHVSKLFKSLNLDCILPSVYPILMYEYIFNVFGAHSQVDVIYTDFAKAFDHVNYHTLLKVLARTEIGELLIMVWLTPFM
ncbi:Hypothetical protein CINCED_3A001825 [Cinara cedri]|uniref:Reverse transcriptase domain n=1 Tax=Cinara cedri TaxID=506608 RepID=A0A5E4NEJ0_9HEMI|nr:Hypothetical protein CINCED_3A001825 [Cinara cedri]